MHIYYKVTKTSVYVCMRLRPQLTYIFLVTAHIYNIKLPIGASFTTHIFFGVNVTFGFCFRFKIMFLKIIVYFQDILTPSHRHFQYVHVFRWVPYTCSICINSLVISGMPHTFSHSNTHIPCGLGDDNNACTRLSSVCACVCVPSTRAPHFIYMTTIQTHGILFAASHRCRSVVHASVALCAVSLFAPPPRALVRSAWSALSLSLSSRRVRVV